MTTLANDKVQLPEKKSQVNPRWTSGGQLMKRRKTSRSPFSLVSPEAEISPSSRKLVAWGSGSTSSAI